MAVDYQKDLVVRQVLTDSPDLFQWETHSPLLQRGQNPIHLNLIDSEASGHASHLF